MQKNQCINYNQHFHQFIFDFMRIIVYHPLIADLAISIEQTSIR